MTADQETSAGTARPPRSLLASRYALEDVLKSGNGVETFLAQDLETGVRVVVKSIDPAQMAPAPRMRFEHETHVLRTLSGAGLPGLHDAGHTDDGRLYLVQPFLEGRTLEEVLRTRDLSVREALHVAAEVATALDVAHGAGICHRDVKPANVMVSGDPVAEVTLIDFGFARSHTLDESIREDLVGTVRYLAPESAGLLASPADARSDLYALGVVLFECLTGRPPFRSANVGELLRQHLSAPVPPVHVPGVEVPRAAEAIVQRLLRKEPGERYQSAAALVADLSALLAMLDAGEPDPRLVIGRLDQRRTLADPAFVGRDAELDVLRELVTSLPVGDGQLVLLDAESGGGKSRLLAEVVQQAQRSGVAVLQGQGVAQAGQRPFSLLQDVAAGLVTMLEAEEPARRDVAAAVGDLAPAVVQALPALTPVLGPGEEEDTGPVQFGEQRSLSALQALLSSIASPQRPILLVLDDCQWADGLTVRLLASFAASGTWAHLAVVAAFRSEEVSRSHPLRLIAEARQLHLGPLSVEAMAMLAESMAGPLPQSVLQTVTRLADGSPFMGAAVLRGLVEAGALVGTEQGWVVDEDALKDARAARRSAAFLVRRLELLSDDALELLSVGAVLGKEFDVATAVALRGISTPAEEILEEARRRRLLWVEEGSAHCTFFHDKIREALLARLDPEARRALHSLAADHLAQAGSASVFDLAYHYDAAARHDAALGHALAAAELARTQHDLDTSIVHYRIAERAVMALAADGAEESTAGARERIAEGLGDVLTLQGGYREAERYLVEARGLAKDPVRTAALEGKLGDVAFKQGDVPTAREHLESAMRHLGRRIPRAGAVLVVLLLWELAVQATHTIAPRLTTGRRPAERDERDVLAMRFYSRLAYVYWFGSGKVMCGWAHLRGMNLAERYPPSAELGQAYSEHAPVVTMLPWFRRGIRYAERSLEIRRALGDVWGQGQSLGFAGVVHYAASNFGEALDACGEAVRLLERTGDQWETNTAGWNIALSHYRRGDLVRAAEVAHAVFLKAEAIGDRASAGIALSVCARACDGALDRALLDAQLSRGSDDVHTSTELLLAAALQRRADDDLEGAAAHLDTAIRAVRRAGLRQEYVAPVHPWYATVLRELAESTSPYDPQLRARRIREAAAAARTARRWARSYRNNAPHALRESALVASMQGRTRRAEKLLSRSLEGALAQGARYEAALTRAATAELASSGGSPATRDAATLEARAMLAGTPGDTLVDTEPDAAVSLFDRFTTLLKVGRAITAATSHAALESGIRDAALQLLRGERCHLVSVRALLDGSLTTQSGESVDELSRTLLRSAIEKGAPVVGGDPGATESESLLLSRIRSVLAAPITVNGVPLGCFYVTHSQIGELFGEEEEQLAAFIATLAGAAYEHLEGSEARFRSLAQNSSDVITLVGRDGVISYQSEAATRVFALPPPGLVGRPVTSWVHDSDLELFAAALTRALDGRETRVECRFRHADGSFRWAETALTNMLDEPTVSALVLNTRDVTERRRLEDELRERALRDALTGLPNRALFLDRARAALERMRQTEAPLVVAFLDLDDFKAVNDSFGHTVGDDLLRAMAERLVRSVRPSDTVARLGGDEFAILLEDTDVETAVAVVERLLEATGRPVPLAGTEVVAHTSIGLASAAGPDTEAEQLLAQADAAMYAAKERGKHCYELFQPAMQEAMQTRSRMRTELDHALSRQELRLRYQPIVDISTGARTGVEALVRWAHPQRGLLGPGDFIDFAEETGQVIEVGAWVLERACRDTARLAPSARTSVNVSARQLKHPAIVRTVREALASSGLAPQRLVLEITETATVTATEAETVATIGKLAELRRLGVQIALDDFGTGYSPLSYLRRFPVDILKVDQSFVANIAHSPEDEAIVRGVLDMARALGLATVAEGVENAEQLAVLTSLGCDRGQGYLWMRPAPLDDVVAWLGVPPPRAGSRAGPASDSSRQDHITAD